MGLLGEWASDQTIGREGGPPRSDTSERRNFYRHQASRNLSLTESESKVIIIVVRPNAVQSFVHITPVLGTPPNPDSDCRQNASPAFYSGLDAISPTRASNSAFHFLATNLPSALVKFGPSLDADDSCQHDQDQAGTGANTKLTPQLCSPSETVHAPRPSSQALRHAPASCPPPPHSVQ